MKINTKVEIKELLLGKVPYMKFLDFNLQDSDSFPSIQFSNYAYMILDLDGTQWVIPKEWKQNIYQFEIMCLLCVPHFGHGLSIAHYI